jgi:hypothetical protein
MSTGPAWVALAWRLPAGSTTPRVTTWRNLSRLGAARLTPGAALLPFREDLQEQLDWLAQDIEAQGGEAWVLPVTGLSEAEECVVRDRMLAERDEEYRGLEEDALAFIARRSAGPAPGDAFAARLQIDKELPALQRRFRKIRARDYVDAPACAAAARAPRPMTARRNQVGTRADTNPSVRNRVSPLWTSVKPAAETTEGRSCTPCDRSWWISIGNARRCNSPLPRLKSTISSRPSGSRTRRTSASPSDFKSSGRWCIIRLLSTTSKVASVKGSASMVATR